MDVKFSGVVELLFLYNPCKFQPGTPLSLIFMHLQMLKIGCVNYASFPKSGHIYRYIPDHKLFHAKAALYIACTNSPSIMGLHYEILASFKGLLKPITSDKRKIQDLWKAFRVSV